MQILEKYRLSFKIDEQQEPMELTKYKEKINMFVLFLKKADVMMLVSHQFTLIVCVSLESERELQGHDESIRRAQRQLSQDVHRVHEV